MIDHEGCRQLLIDCFVRQGVDAVVSTAEPLIPNPYVTSMRCPHGVEFFMEPTSEQQMQWTRDGVR